ncbi:MAG: 16S rRNA (cytidine(1402)-2'-O)-methyltransferase [Alphaproteobacteria bacterium]|nr:16S rRNA (cytidine(1402)-2'-O)-methyltransferase [Alphaproteobacteria bacterium]
MQPGLYIIGTPIGNLSDMSPRAIETLQNVDLIVCEDTRVSGKLATHFDIKTRRIAMHEHNERDMAGVVADMIAGRLDANGAQVLEGTMPGLAVALISDSGMPTISDPGFRLVRECRVQKLSVFVVPGPTAFASALVLSGFPTDRFTFCGFFKDEKHLASDNKIRHTIIYYESPNRIMDTIGTCARICPERRIAIVREITKIHEETIIGYPSELLNITPPRGEIVLIIEPAPDTKMSDNEINEIVRDIVAGANSTKDKAAEIAARTGISKSEAYEKVIKNGN